MKKVMLAVRSRKGKAARGGMPFGGFLVGICALGIWISLSAGGAEAFNPADLEKLMKTWKCSRCDLSGANLSGRLLMEADLSGANLSMANLSGADVRKANLDGANLSGANLGGTNLFAANLSAANLGGANLYEAFLCYANLRGANLSGANLGGANLGRAIWTDGRTCAENGSIGQCK
ncbi:MAG: pentapeptide repeat-containing protein [Syntrophales bacterium]|nr:pentapeptide repeat-containing protein [Syntrophales bacterium]MDD5233151.1 pentapeptide repeat-containing protein [Syntrophales bacterium]MDD5531337.1 pentapeptide repeat-containing protein [Syntrophales bacterium]